MKFTSFGLLLALLSLGCVTSQDDGGCPPTGLLPYDYAQALCMSSLFYEAQRSGYLPDDQRVTWRGDSAVDDGSDHGVDLEGGYFDAGDFVKFGLPGAYTVTGLSWGLIDYPAGYEIAGQTGYARATVKWGSDYLLKAHTGPTEFYGQVGDPGADHAYWGRPEEMTMARPSWAITASSPGSDLAAEAAAALAATSMVFQEADPTYSSTCLAAAIELYDFADQYKELYSTSIPTAQGFYTSTSYNDELVWGALWLFRATGDDGYLQKAKDYYGQFAIPAKANLMDWNSKEPGVMALLAAYGGEPYITDLTTYVDYLIDNQPHTPLGLVYMDMWGNLREANDVAFIALRASALGINTAKYQAWAQQQTDYALGSTGRSFVCGFGVNPPQRPHHRAASCPSLPDVCDWDQETSPDPNPQVLYGAIVGGPDENDQYTDDRLDYIHNEVAIDYNALFTSILAAFTELQSA